MQKEFQEFKKIVNTNRTFVLTTHVNPDGDAIGSETALARYLSNKGKSVHIINESGTPGNLRFLEDIFPIEQFNPKLHYNLVKETDCFIVLDANSTSRFSALIDPFSTTKASKIIIDHHLDHEGFASLNIIDTAVPATCELLYRLLVTIDERSISAEIATALYTGIMTDTQSFRLPLTTPETHTIISDLLKKGVKPHVVYEHVYESGALNTLQLLGHALNSITLHHDGKVAVMFLPRRIFLETKTNESDVDNLSQYVMSMHGVKVGIVITELEDCIKISLRSKEDIPVNKVANHFGGGGHKNAAGAKVATSTFNTIVSEVLEQVSLHI